ncbi:hypothetical protein NW759_015184 [Fusarium solani]|nr:hypothetical protein NW759_015184 [Fusarium solani]
MPSPGYPPPPRGASRIWRACENCRKKKRKCNGAAPCSYCNARGLPCIYPVANDNAAQSRQDAVNMSIQYDRLDSLCVRMENMMARLSTAVEVLEESPEEPRHTSPRPPASRVPTPSLSAPEESIVYQGHAGSSQMEFEDYTPCRNLAEMGNLIPDTGNTNRYFGGISNTLSVNMFRSCTTQPTVGEVDQILPSCLTSALYGASPARPMSRAGSQDCKAPPRYMSDTLVNLFLVRLNPMFPILDDASFTLQYKQYLGHSVTHQEPSPFRSVLFAVYACASNMLGVPRQNQDNYSGTDYYELSLSDHYRTLGYDGVEQIQCLAILATCAASWNRLTEAWKLAGQAVRAAQDLGLHVEFAGSGQDQSRSRVWWCVYTLNSCLSTCLGRPTGVGDADHDCGLPDTTQEISRRAGTGSSPREEAATDGSPLAGFIALAQACRILDTINSSSQDLMRDARGNDEMEHRCMGDNQAVILEAQLSEWVRDKIPSSIKYAANEPEENGGINLAICMVTFMLHAIAVINLNLPLIEIWNIDASMFEIQEVGAGGSVCKVITAARGIIRGSELISSNIPPSHYLAFCVHLLYLSGFVL